MLVSNRLRIDPGNGIPAVEYRIENGFVETRTLETRSSVMANSDPSSFEGQWQRLTPQQLTSRVLQNRVVAHWLRNKMGLHQLVRACSQEFSDPSYALDENRTAA